MLHYVMKNKQTYHPHNENNKMANQPCERVCGCSRNPTKTFAISGPGKLHIDMPSTWQYIVSWKLNETDLVVSSISSINIYSGNNGGPKWLWYQKSAQKLMVSSKGMLVNKEHVSNETKISVFTQRGSWHKLKEIRKTAIRIKLQNWVQQLNEPLG